MPLFRALAKNMAPMTNADESPTNRLTLFPIYLSLFVVSTLWSHGFFVRLNAYVNAFAISQNMLPYKLDLSSRYPANPKYRPRPCQD